MKMKRFKVYKLLFSIVLLFVLCSVSILSNAEVKEPIEIGMMADITGVSAGNSSKMWNAAKILNDILNEKGGIHGYPVNITTIDGQSDPAVHATKAYRLIESNKVLSACGSVDISTATAAGKIFQDKKTTFLNVCGCSVAIPLVGDYIFSTSIPDNDHGRAIAKFIIDKLGYKKICIFKDIGSTYGTKLTEYTIYFLEAFTGRKDYVPLVLPYHCTDNDYTAQLTRLKANIEKMGIEAILLPTWPEDLPKIARQARELEINLPLIGALGSDVPTTEKVGGESVEGLVLTAHASIDQPNVPDAVKDFAKRYEEKYKEAPTCHAITAYDAIMVQVKAISNIIEEKGEKWWNESSLADKRIAIRDEIAIINTGTSTSSPYTFRPEGWPRKGLAWKIVRNGERLYYDYQSYEDFTPEGINVLPFM